MAEYEPDENPKVEEYETDEGSRYANLYQNTALRVVAAIVIIVLLVLGGRALHHHLKKDNNTPTVTTTSKITSTTSGTNGASGSSTNSSGSNPSSNSSNSNKPAPTQVPNTGPGDVVAIFLAVTFAAYLLHLGLTSRKTN